MPLLSTFANAGARGYGLAGVGLATAPGIGTATATGASSASVTYTAPLSDGGSPITSYTAVASPGGQTATVYQSGSGTISVTGLSQGEYYTFTVYATNALGNSPPSASSNQIRTYGVPDAPTIGFASLNGTSAADVSYSAPAYNGGSAITSYTAVSSPGGYSGSVSTSSSGSIYVSGLQANTSYNFRVYATNAYGSSSYSGFSNTITTPAPITVSASPTSFSVGPQSYGAWSYRTLNVTAFGGTGTITVQEITRPSTYRVSVDNVIGQSSPTYSTATKNFTLTGGQSIQVTLGMQWNGPYTPSGGGSVDGVPLPSNGVLFAVVAPNQSNIIIVYQV
jgi:hypothetical protein